MKAYDSPPRKRKPIRGKSSEAIEKKKAKDDADKKSSFTSSLLSTSNTRSSLMQGELYFYSFKGAVSQIKVEKKAICLCVSFFIQLQLA